VTTSVAEPGDVLSVRNLRIAFYTRGQVLRAVDGVEFSIRRASTVGLVGETGCGKSTVALSLVRLVPSPGRIEGGGAILFRGRDLLSLSERQMTEVRGKSIGVVFQESANTLDPVQKIGHQLCEAVRAHESISRRGAIGRASEMLAAVGIGAIRQRLDAYPHELSGGMRQRVGIALALICRPALLLADEPTTALDVTVQAQIVELLKNLRDDLSLSMLLISHDIAVISELADELLVMYAGKIVERGETSTVLQYPKHPYTQALLRAIPTPATIVRQEPLVPIDGTVPSADAWPEGCRFAPRCSYVHAQCLALEPPLIGDRDHAAACWLLQPNANGGASIERRSRPRADT